MKPSRTPRMVMRKVAELTPRELEVLRLLMDGHRTKQIADRLQITDGAVRNHLHSVNRKFGVRDRTQAVLRAVKLFGLPRPSCDAVIVEARLSTSVVEPR